MSGRHPVEIVSVVHRYGARLALDDVSLEIDPGVIFGLLGPNGSGKTTLFKIMATLLVPTSGRVTIAGANVVSDASTVRRMIGTVFQSPSVDGQLSVAENLRHQGMLYGLSGADLRRRSDEQMTRFGLAARASDRVATLSGGLRRRVELAKVMLHRPSVLILDEPSTGLDPGARTELMDHLKRLRDEHGVTSMLTTHLLDEADHCDRLGVMDGGRLVALDSPEALKRSIGGEVVAVRCHSPHDLAQRLHEKFGGTADVVDGVVRLEVVHGHTLVPEIIEAFPGVVDSITVGRPTLGDVFVHLTGHGLWTGSDAITE